MNQGRIWCVVHPTVGLPLFLGSVASISFIVHACVLTQTTWFPNYWQGGAKRTEGAKTQTSENRAPTPAAVVTPQGSPAFAITVAPVAPAPGKTETAFVVTVTPTPAVTQAVATPPPERTGGSTLALAKPPER
jgi:light-harvesting protein B-800-850 alpha chain